MSRNETINLSRRPLSTMKIENFNKPSKSYSFMRFCIRLRLLPIEDGHINEVRFKLLSWRAVAHIVLYHGLMIVFFLFQSLYAYFNNFSLSKPSASPMGKIAAYSSSIITISVVFPIVIAKGLNGFPQEIILNNNSKWPRGIGKIIMGFFLRFTGSAVWGFSFYLALHTEKKHKLILSLQHLVITFYFTLFYSLPIILVGILVENFKEVCKHRDNDETKHVKYCLSVYKHLTNSLANFYFLYFSVVQILFITWTFNSFTQLLEERDHQLHEYIMFLGCIVGIGK